MEDGMTSPPRFRFRLSEAIDFARGHGLGPEASQIAAMAIHPSISRPWAVRRACFIELFEARGLIESFAAQYWTERSSPQGEAWRQAQFDLKQRNEPDGPEPPGEDVDDDTDLGGDVLPLPGDVPLSLERDMERSLLQDLAQLENGLRLYNFNGRTGDQFDTGVVGRLDVLAIDGRSNLVVIELKAGRADDRVCGQILRYMGWVRTHVANGQNVRGIIVANDFTESLKFAARAMSDVALKKYRVRFEFADV
jgi:hypothetical protein